MSSDEEGQVYEGWGANARPAVIGLAVFVSLLLLLVVASGAFYVHRYAAQTRPTPHAFPRPELELIDSAPSDRRAIPAPTPPVGIDDAMAATVSRGDSVWNAS